MSDRYWSPSSRSALVHHCQTPPPRPRHAAAWAGAAGWRGKQEAAPAVGQWEWIAVGQWRFQYYRAVVDCRRPSVNSNSAKVSVRLSFWGCVKAELRNATEPQLKKRRRLGSASRKGGGGASREPGRGPGSLRVAASGASGAECSLDAVRLEDLRVRIKGTKDLRGQWLTNGVEGEEQKERGIKE